MAKESGIFITNIESDTINNKFYRKVLFTAGNQQLVLQSVKPKQDIDFEVHHNNDQFVRVEKGTGQLLIGPNKEFKYDLSDGIAFVIPAGTWHQIVNTSSSEDLKLYTIYSPPHHPKDLIEVDKPKSQTGASNKSHRSATKRNHLY